MANANKNWSKISDLEEEVTSEKEENKKRFIRSLNRTVRYLQQVQLQHVASGKYLGHLPTKTSAIELRNFSCTLLDLPSDRTRFTVHPVLPGYYAGDSVCNGDVIKLFKDFVGFVRESAQPVCLAKSFYPAVPEINIGSANNGFKLHIVHQLGKINNQISAMNDSELETITYSEKIAGTNIIQLRQSGTNQYFAQNQQGFLSLRKFPETGSSQTCEAVSTYWIIEHEMADGYFNGEDMKFSSDIRIRNFMSGEFAKISQLNEGDDFEHVKFNIEHALEFGNDCKPVEETFKYGAQIKLKTNNGFIGVDEEKGALCYKPNFKYTDTVNIRAVSVSGKRFGARVLGLRLLFQKILAIGAVNINVKLKNYQSVLAAFRNATDLIGSQPSSAQNIFESGILINLIQLAKIYITCDDKNYRIMTCLDAVCGLLNQLTRTLYLKEFKKEFLELISLLIDDGFLIHAKSDKSISYSDDESEDEERFEVKKVLSPLRSLINESLYLLSIIPKEFIKRLIIMLDNFSDEWHKKEVFKVLCCLCKTHQHALSQNQEIIFECMFSSQRKSTSLFKIQFLVGSGDVIIDDIPLSTIDKTSNVYHELLSQLEMYESLLNKRHRNHRVRDKLVDQHGMFTLKECVSVIISKKIDYSIRSWYIQILIAIYIDAGSSDTSIVSQMLTFQYEEIVIKNKYSTKDNSQPPHETQLLYQNLLLEIETFLRTNISSSTDYQEDSPQNMLFYQMMRLLEHLFRAGFIDKENECKFIPHVIALLDENRDQRTCDSIFRIKPCETNKLAFRIKLHAIRALYHAFEKSLFYYWTSIVKEIYSSVKNYNRNKDAWLSQVTDFLGMSDVGLNIHQVIVRMSEDPSYDILSSAERKSRTTLMECLTENYNRIDLFSRVDDLVSVTVNV